MDNKKINIANYLLANKVNILFGAGAPKCKLENKGNEFPLMTDLVTAVKSDNTIQKCISDIKSCETDQKDIIIQQLSIHKNNVEGLLSSLEGINYFITDEYLKNKLEQLLSLIKFKIINRIDSSSKEEPLNNYKMFFSSLRDLNQIKNFNNVVNIFTTNYDMLCEESMDILGIHYYNGFVGNYRRSFNTNYYKYKYVENVDLNKSKYYQKKDHFNLFKLHGSFSWRNDKNGELYEVQDYKNSIVDCQLIQPSSNKFISVALLPYYSTLLREFSNNIKQEKSVLLTIGYGYGDLHINSLIKEALMLDQFTLIAGVYSEENKDYIISQLGGMKGNIQFVFKNDSTLLGIAQSINQRTDGDIHEKK